MASTPEQKSEGTIASRLRSSSRKTLQTKGVEGKPCQLEKEIKTEKVTKKRSCSDSKTKDLSSNIILNTSGKEEEKDNKPSSSKQQATKKPKTQQPIHYIRWEGIEDTSTQWNCDMCKLDLAKEDQERSIQHGDELQYYLLSSQGREDDLSGTVLPEVVVLPCSHVFHIKCLSASLQLTYVIDPSCPNCEKNTCMKKNTTSDLRNN